MNGIYQCLACPVFPIESVKIFAADLKGGDASHGVLDPDPVQAAAPAEQKGADKDVGGLVAFDGDHLPKKKSKSVFVTYEYL